MSKTKLAILVFCVAFAVNALAFLLTKKAFTIDETKSVWLYELPPTASPLDAYPALDLGPQQGVIGTFFRPHFETAVDHRETPLETFLAQSWTWDQKSRALLITLRPNLIYSDETPILASHWVQASEWVKSKLKAGFTSHEWTAWMQSTISAPDATHLKYTWATLPAEFDLPRFLKEVMTNPLTGVIHPANLESLKKGEKITKEWLSSGPYKVRKWNPKEIILVSRDHFPIMVPKEFFRTLRFQSAPVKNPACEFMQAAVGEVSPDQAHQVVPVSEMVHVYWICRSWKDPKSFCGDATNRAWLDRLLNHPEMSGMPNWSGKALRYRIPQGSDAFREQIRTRIAGIVTLANGKAEEISYLFKASTDADIELEFVVTPDNEDTSNLAEILAKSSSRLGEDAITQPNLVGELSRFPMSVLMKDMHGEVFSKVFMEPDLAEKEMGI